MSGFIKISHNQNYIQIWFNQKIPENDALISQLLPLDPIDKSILEKKFDKYLEEKNNNVDRWMTLMTILSTIFAVFFVYSGFRIDKDLREVQEKWYDFLDKIEKKYNEKILDFSERVKSEKEELNKKNEEEKEELRNELSFIREISYIEKQINEIGNHDESIAKLNELLKDERNSNNNERYNRILLLVSKAYLWKWIQNNEILDLSQALVIAKEAIEDASDPYIVRLVELFNENWKKWENV